MLQKREFCPAWHHSLTRIHFFPAKTRTAHRWPRNYLWNGWEHGQISYKDTNAKCRHLRKLASKGTLRQVFFRVYRLSPPPSSLFQSNIYTYNLWLGAGGGCWVLLETIYEQQEFNALYLTRFRTYKITRPPQTKIQEGRGPQTDKHQPKSQIFRRRHFALVSI